MTSGHHPTSGPPDDQAGHPDLDSLADLDAGLHDPATASLLTRHVDECQVCRRSVGALAAVRADLRSLPTPRMPEAVAARMEATLAELRNAGPVPQSASGPVPDGGQPAVAAASGQPSGQRPVPPASLDPVADLDSAREQRRERSRRLTTWVAASVVVVAAVVGAGTAVLREGKGGRSKVTESAALPHDSRGGMSAGADSQAGAGRVTPEQHGQAAPGAAPAPGHVPSYTRLTLVEALPEIERTATVAAISVAGQQGPGGVMADATRRQTCSASISGASGSPIAVQQVTFERTAAFVFVYGDSELDRRVFVVTAGCGLDPELPATVLFEVP